MGTAPSEGEVDQIRPNGNTLMQTDEAEEEESPFGGPKPIVPFSSLFIFSPTNP